MINKKILSEDFPVLGPRIHFLSSPWRSSVVKFYLCFKLGPGATFTVMSFSE